LESKKQLYTFLTLIGTGLLFFCIYQTKELYFKKSVEHKPAQSKAIAPTEGRYAIPKLKIFSNEKLNAQKIVSESKNTSADLDLEDKALRSDKSNQQILTHNYLIKVLSQQQNYLRRCYENHLRENPAPSEKGTIVVDFMVLPFGEIRDVEIKDSSFNDKTFENCIKTVFLRTQVKKFNGEKFLITFPLEFE
jgi:hypothetical protein